MIAAYTITFIYSLVKECYIVIPFFIWNIFLFIPIHETVGIGAVKISWLFTKPLPEEFQYMLSELHWLSLGFFLYIALPLTVLLITRHFIRK